MPELPHDREDRSDDDDPSPFEGEDTAGKADDAVRGDDLRASDEGIADPGDASAPQAGFPWGGEPAKILERLLDGDPLELAWRCRARIETLALLVDLDRVHLRTAARVAHAAPRYLGEPPLEEWLEERIDRSIRELIDEDREEERKGAPPSEPWDPRYAFVSETLGVEPKLARRACLAFNNLAPEVRCAYFAVAVQGKTVNRYVAEGHGPPEKVKDHIERALRAISKAIGRPFGGRDPGSGEGPGEEPHGWT